MDRKTEYSARLTKHVLAHLHISFWSEAEGNWSNLKKTIFNQYWKSSEAVLLASQKKYSCVWNKWSAQGRLHIGNQSKCNTSVPHYDIS